ncbi:MAG: Gfo/Idh/MocA family oxidoreductase [Alphaproteobacteria bacterium]|nr:Gfo/Idh/MocA family oxidoreductase [Alphaproteobacteria bacterium]
MINVGLVGAGKIVETFHLPAWKQVPNARVTAICDPRLDAATALATQHEIPRIYESVQAMIADTAIDAVDICSPHRLHKDHAMVALRAGLHCLIEKPFATTSKDALAIAAAARANDRVVMCAQHQRFRPPSMALKKMIEAGDLGEIYSIRVDAMNARGIPRQVGNSFTDAAISGGGPLIDQGAHGIDLAWWLMGCPAPRTAFAVTSAVTAPKSGRTPSGAEWDVYTVEDFATGILTFADQRSITIHTSYYAHCRRDRFGCEVLGSAGGAVWPELTITRPDGDDVKTETIHPHEDHLASVEELRHFTALISQDASPLIPLEQSVTVVRMMEALYRSAKTSKAVPI